MIIRRKSSVIFCDSRISILENACLPCIYWLLPLGEATRRHSRSIGRSSIRHEDARRACTCRFFASLLVLGTPVETFCIKTGIISHNQKSCQIGSQILFNLHGNEVRGCKNPRILGGDCIGHQNMVPFACPCLSWRLHCEENHERLSSCFLRYENYGSFLSSENELPGLFNWSVLRISWHAEAKPETPLLFTGATSRTHQVERLPEPDIPRPMSHTSWLCHASRLLFLQSIIFIKTKIWQWAALQANCFQARAWQCPISPAKVMQCIMIPHNRTGSKWNVLHPGVTFGSGAKFWWQLGLGINFLTEKCRETMCFHRFHSLKRCQIDWSRTFLAHGARRFWKQWQTVYTVLYYALCQVVPDESKTALMAPWEGALHWLSIR